MGVTRSGGSLWVFYNIQKDAFYHGLSFQEARAIVKVFSLEERAQWFVWKEGWTQWKKMSAAGELLVTTSTVLRVMEPPVLPKNLMQHTPTPTKSKSEIFIIDDINDEATLHKTVTQEFIADVKEDGDDAPQKSLEVPENFVVRKDQRVIVEIDVDIISQGQKFHTRTIDISVSGLQVKDSIPVWLAGYCTLILHRPDSKQQLEFVCSIVENQDPTQKKRLEIHPSKDTVHLKRWLLDFYIHHKRGAVG
ncbi:MAG: hypothetical protein A4S09_02835 [Proteobacteria bacterium SG_bin7]|nr:MAG: hypothetical protein A4S09_02835 [Proteobacteria bacterium SG_bin7]